MGDVGELSPWQQSAAGGDHWHSPVPYLYASWLFTYLGRKFSLSLSLVRSQSILYLFTQPYSSLSVTHTLFYDSFTLFSFVSNPLSIYFYFFLLFMFSTEFYLYRVKDGRREIGKLCVSRSLVWSSHGEQSTLTRFIVFSRLFSVELRIINHPLMERHV